MPYIESGIRASLNEGRKATKPGELNFQISTLVDNYLVTRNVSYTSLNEVMGVLTCVSQEIYRRIAVPYEDKKQSENGEVFVSVSR